MRRLISISGAGSRGQVSQPPAHRALLADARGNLGEHVEFAVLGQQLDRDTRAGFLPGPGEELVSQDAIGGLSAFPPDTAPADRCAHFRQHRFSEDAATHHPDAPGTAVLLILARNMRSVVRFAVLPGSTS